MSSRLPRFKRASAVAHIQLTVRDREIIRHVHRHRFLRSWQIVALVGGSPQQIVRRLQLLYHHGYLERPRCQLEYYYAGGSRHIIYGLGNGSKGVLGKGLSAGKFRLGEKNRSAGRMFLNHALLVSDVMVALELACRKAGTVRLIHGEDLPLPDKIRAKRQPYKWSVKASAMKLGAIPDRVFALDSGGSRAFFFLEADRGTMPVGRRNLAQTSFRRKLIAYEATWNQDVHRLRFGFHRFRVLVVTKSAARVKSLVHACGQLKSGHGLFLFADQAVLSGDILSHKWQTGRPGETAALVT